jgi:hypothetical protein
MATVDFPEAERPVNQIVKPRCLRNSLRSCREREACQVILLVGLISFVVGWRGCLGGMKYSRCHFVVAIDCEEGEGQLLCGLKVIGLKQRIKVR